MIENIKELRETLIEAIQNSSNVFIVGHEGPDIDSIGSAIALSYLASYLGKEAYIIVDDDELKIEPRLKTVIDKYKEKYHIIKKKEFLEKANKKSLLILSDINNTDRLSVADSLGKVGSIFTIDHHGENELTVPANHIFISLNVSSACEIITRVLMNGKIPYDKEIASLLYAGIALDTKNFDLNTNGKTHDTAEKLLFNGANKELAEELLKEEYDSYCRVKGLVISGAVFKKYTESVSAPTNVAFALNRERPKQIYYKEEFAKAANDLINLSGVNAAFAMGYVEPGIVHISARSGKRVDVGIIMEKMGGGGNSQLAGGKFQTEDILGLENELMGKVKYGIREEEETIESPPPMQKRP